MNLLGIFKAIDEKSNPPPRSVEPNAANKIAEHLKAKWPELVGIPGLWFSGSQVWSHLYGKEPPTESDLDVFACQDAQPVVSYLGVGTFLGMSKTERTPIGEMLHRLGLKPEEGRTKNTAGKPHYHVNGADFTHPTRGEIDVWTTAAKDAVTCVKGYPRSHSHCRAAFSFTEGLVVLPNEAA